MAESKDVHRFSLRKWIAILFGTALLLWALSGWIIVANCESPERRGQFGDMFGAINALFTGFAFAGALLAIRTQQEEIRKQNETLAKQQFEATFFQMLSLHNQFVSALDIEKRRDGAIRDYTTMHGRECFQFFETEIRDQLKHLRQYYPNTDINDQILEAYMFIYSKRRGDLGHYFRSLYNIFKMIETSEGVENKEFYSKVARAQISDYELTILFLNCLNRYGVEKFKPLAEKYAILKHVSFGDLVSKSLVLRYEPRAFGEEENYLEKMKAFQ